MIGAARIGCIAIRRIEHPVVSFRDERYRKRAEELELTRTTQVPVDQLFPYTLPVDLALKKLFKSPFRAQVRRYILYQIKLVDNAPKRKKSLKNGISTLVTLKLPQRTGRCSV